MLRAATASEAETLPRAGGNGREGCPPTTVQACGGRAAGVTVQRSSRAGSARCC